jgi:NAD(P)H-hydrate epimerase
MKGVTYGSRQLNKLLDDTLMEKHHFASETLMELAGLAVAQVAHKILKRSAQQGESQTVCVLVGPGNNGGDGLVAARHLSMMRYKVDLIVFKQLEGKNGNYHNLCNLHAIPTRTPEQF